MVIAIYCVVEVRALNSDLTNLFAIHLVAIGVPARHVYITNTVRYNFGSQRQVKTNIQMMINIDERESLSILFTSARCLLKGDEYCIKSHVPTGKLLEP